MIKFDNIFNKSVEGIKMTKSFSTFDGFFCISWRSPGGIVKVLVQDEVKANDLFNRIHSTKSRSCSLVILSQDNKVLKLA